MRRVPGPAAMRVVITYYNTRISRGRSDATSDEHLEGPEPAWRAGYYHTSSGGPE